MVWWTSRSFWRDAAERASRTAAQAALGVLGATSVDAIDWKGGAVTIVIATISSVLMSVAASGKGDPQSASLLRRNVEPSYREPPRPEEWPPR